MTLRGAQAPDATTATCALRGLLLEDPRARSEFLALTRGGDR
jgi:GTP cyclohydrolase I